MADEEGIEEESGKSSEGKSGGMGNKLIMIIAGVVLVFLLIVGGVIAMLLSSGGGEEMDVGEAPTNLSQKPSAGGGGARQSTRRQATSYVTVGPIYELDKFVVNLITKRGKRYLRVKISLEIDSENVIGELEMKKVVLSDTIIDTLTSRTKQELSTSKGKNRLKDELISRINSSLIDGMVTNVFFTEFIIQ